MKKSSYLGFFALLGTSFIYGIFGIIVRALNPFLSANQMTFSRALIVSVILLILLLRKKVPLFSIRKKLVLPLIVHSVTFGFTIFLFTYAVLLTSLSKSTFSFYSTTLVASLLVSIFYFKEGFSFRKKVSFFLALAALLFYILPSGVQSIDLGMIFTAIAGVSDVVTNSMKKLLGGKLDRKVLVFYQMLTGVVFAASLIVIHGEYTIKQAFTLGAVLWLLFFALNFFLLSYLTAYGFQHFDLNLGTIILSMEFVFATIIGVLFYKELLTMPQILASLLLVVSISFMNLPERRRRVVSVKE